MITKTFETMTEPHAPFRVADSPVLHLGAPWLRATPWVWRCPDCATRLRSDEENAVVSAARKHRTDDHPVTVRPPYLVAGE